MYQSKKRGSQEEIIKVGDVVLMQAENVPRSSWKLAIGVNSGVTNHSIHLLYPLEVTLMDPKEHFTGTDL